ncbi:MULTISPECIES: restriction endonuclease [unclassified Thioalkalivibrio]|uniref:restriction endonuclease n=1 Tax=unclassified Thioalkalivibrio TaxID=2621013 RepID=UPI00037E1DDE|nr:MULTISPECIES: restriction endonuclease [unclassified Thioalkalivibrio]
MADIFSHPWLLAAALTSFFAIALGWAFLPRARSSQRYRIKQSRKILERLPHLAGEVGSHSHRARVLSYLRKIDPFTFEEMLLEAFKRAGFPIKRNKRYTGDGGIDGRVRIDGVWCFIQAKRYSSYVSAQHVRDFQALCDRMRTPGLFIHTGRTSPGTRALFQDHAGTVLVTGGELYNLLLVGKFSTSCAQ